LTGSPLEKRATYTSDNTNSPTTEDIENFLHPFTSFPYFIGENLAKENKIHYLCSVIPTT
jgi:hypothetical protein